MKKNYHQDLEPNHEYHLFSRAVGDEKLFRTVENYNYFLQKLKHHTDAVCKLYAYTLLPNHFHLLVKIEDEKNIILHFEEKKNKKFDYLQHSIAEFIMERFSNFLNGYTKAYNKMYERKGALFLDFLKRSKANNDADFSAFVFYVHKNAVHHGYTKHIGDWQFDSYPSLLSNAPTSLLRNELIDFFGSQEAFIKFHQQPVNLKVDFVDV